MIRTVLLGITIALASACGASAVPDAEPIADPMVMPLTPAQERVLLDDLASFDVIVIGSTEGEGPRDHLIIEEVLRVPPNVRLSNRVPFRSYSTDSDGRMLYAYSLTESKAFSLHDLDMMPEVEVMIRRELRGD